MTSTFLKFFFLSFMCLSIQHTNGQEVASAAVMLNGEVNISIDKGGFTILLSPTGQIAGFAVKSKGSVSYDMNNKVNAIGSTRISYDLWNRISQIGEERISYNLHEKVSQIGDVSISYNLYNKVSQIGTQRVSYNMNGQVVEL